MEKRIELAAKARVDGDVFYKLIEMAMGAEVNGSLVHKAEPEDVSMPFGKAPPLDLASEGQS